MTPYRRRDSIAPHQSIKLWSKRPLPSRKLQSVEGAYIPQTFPHLRRSQAKAAAAKRMLKRNYHGVDTNQLVRKFHIPGKLVERGWQVVRRGKREMPPLDNAPDPAGEGVSPVLVHGLDSQSACKEKMQQR